MPGEVPQNGQKTSENEPHDGQGPKGSQTGKEGLFGHKKHLHEDKVSELTETLKRLQAEFENYQKRSAKQNAEFASFANAKLIEELLPVLDTLEQGIQHNKDLAPVQQQLFRALKKNGLEKIRAEKGQKYNHETMECLMQEQNPVLENDAVANVMLSGYTLNGRVLRAAKVSVNVLEKGEENKRTGEESKENENKTQ